MFDTQIWKSKPSVPANYPEKMQYVLWMYLEKSAELAVRTVLELEGYGKLCFIMS